MSLSSVVRLVVWLCLLSPALWAQDRLPRADGERMQARIEALAQFGANGRGGIDRPAYSKADIQARVHLMVTMRALGLRDIRIDAAGNLRARRPGTDRQAKPILVGSHIDTLDNWGRYAGAAGVIAALELVDLLNAGDIRTRHPVDIVVFSNEEGGLVGSLALAGQLEPEVLDIVGPAGVSIREGLRAIGGKPRRLEEAALVPGDLTAFLELYIEQGSSLRDQDAQIGVVEGIVGVAWWDVTVRGTAAHAGTTPMDRREDALVAAADLIHAVERVARTTPGRQVATIGRISADPGVLNMIPGEVELGLEIRDLDRSKIAALFEAVRTAARSIEDARGVRIAFSSLEVAGDPAPTDPGIRAAIARSAEQLSLKHLALPSGAGHDAQIMTRIAPTGMIFIPSDGVSPGPSEATRPRDLANGADVLLRTVLALDAQGARVDPLSARVQTEDARRFAQLFKDSGGAPSAEALQTAYLDPGSRAVELIAAADLAAAVAADPDLYARAIDVCLPAAEAATDDLRAIYLAFDGLLTNPALPQIHALFGANRGGGREEADSHLVALEVLCRAAPTEQAVRALLRQSFARETVHALQAPIPDRALARDPLLALALREGIADFIGSLVLGAPPMPERHARGIAREAEIWAQFQADRAKVKDQWDRLDRLPAADQVHRRWLDKAGNPSPDQPAAQGQSMGPSMGPFIGARIARAYYDRVQDKRQAIQDLLAMTDAEAILARSGYAP